ncbi:putative transcript [Fasciola hepatica]|uniref:Transcript n=1 Tax=Fasciola hepatica TaxID=6192 RepID=A0A4E0RZA5_FASHE|nr:putative transcript [Fasciola hepatica]
MEEDDESHAFHRMSSQRRRKLWSLAARAAAKCPDETEKSNVPHSTSEVTGISPFWSKDSLVKTQDSGVSVDLHSDGLQCGSMNASFTSTQQRVSFEVKNPLNSPGQVKLTRNAPRRLHSDQEYGPSEFGLRLRSRVSSGLGPRDSLAISVPQDVYDSTSWRMARNMPSRKRRVSSQQWGSAETSGLGSSLDWASMDVAQKPQIRHFSASFSPNPQRIPGNPVAMRSLDESNLHSGPVGLYLQTPTACLTPSMRPRFIGQPSERGITSLHSSPIRPHRSIRPLPPRSRFIPLGVSEFRAAASSHQLNRDPFQHPSYTVATPVPFLVTRSLDQADPQQSLIDQASPSITRRTTQYHSVPGSIGHSSVTGLTHINPRYAHSLMHSNMHEYANVRRSRIPIDRQYHQGSPFLTPATAVPGAGYSHHPEYPVTSLCELCPQDNVRRPTSLGRRRTMEYESPIFGTELYRIGRQMGRGSGYRRSRTLEETYGSQPTRIDSYHHPSNRHHRPLIMYSVPPPTDELDPCIPHQIGSSARPLPRAPPWYNIRVECESEPTGRNVAFEPSHAVLPHRMRYSHEEPILEDWDAEQERWTYAPTAGTAHPTQRDGEKAPIVRTAHPVTGFTPVEKRVPGRKRPRQSSPPLSRAHIQTGSEEIAVARRIVPQASGPLLPSVRAETVNDEHKPRRGDTHSHSHNHSGDQSKEPTLPESSTQYSAFAGSDQPHSVSSASSSSELRCLQVPHFKLRSTISSSDRPLVNPAFLALPSEKQKPKVLAVPLTSSEVPDLDRDAPDTGERVKKPLQSVLKNRGPDSSTDRALRKHPGKSVSLEEDQNVNMESADQLKLHESRSSVPLQLTPHLFIDPTILEPEKDDNDYDDHFAGTIVSRAPVETVPSSSLASTSLTQTAAAASSLGIRGTAVPYDQSRLAVHISTAEVEQFAEYWDHSVFATARITAVGLAAVATVCLVCSAGASTWIYQGTDMNVTHSGFWKRCNYLNQTCQLTIPFLTKRDGWQDGALCILILAILLGILGTALALAGHVVFALSKRLYYFHSSGEAHVIAGEL